MIVYKIALHVTFDFVRVLYTWWNSLNAQIQVIILDRGISDLVNAILREFIERWSDHKVEVKKKFLNVKLCDLNKFDQYVCKI